MNTKDNQIQEKFSSLMNKAEQVTRFSYNLSTKDHRTQEKLFILMDMATQVARFSRDPSTKVGAIIVTNEFRPISWGYNGFPAGIDDSPELYLNREEKLNRVIHAEENAILNMRNNAGQFPLIMICTHKPCHRCMTSIIQSGIKQVFYKFRPDFEKRSHETEESYKLSNFLALEAGVELIHL